MKHLYLFSGLGADCRVFQNMDFGGFDVTHIDWITPKTNESITDYALRVSAQITTPHPVLVGLSFGGLIATEVAKYIDYEQLILLASVKIRSEIPFYYRLAGHFRLHRLIPTALMKQPNWLSAWLFGIESQSDKAILAAVLLDTDPVFLRWAIDQLVRWENVTPPSRMTHIHGSADRILPILFVHNAVAVVGGGHFMTLNKADELSRLLRQVTRT